MPPRKTTPAPPPVSVGAAPGPAPCPVCGSGACALTGFPWCRHNGQARDPDPTAAARLAALRIPIRPSVRSAA